MQIIKDQKVNVVAECECAVCKSIFRFDYRSESDGSNEYDMERDHDSKVMSRVVIGKVICPVCGYRNSYSHTVIVYDKISQK